MHSGVTAIARAPLLAAPEPAPPSSRLLPRLKGEGGGVSGTQAHPKKGMTTATAVVTTT